MLDMTLHEGFHDQYIIIILHIIRIARVLIVYI